MKKISVIVPIYNVAPYLERCILSLVNQTIDDIEILLIDDGSKDDSGAIMDRLVALYPQKLRGFHKENGGLSDARNYGLRYAQGEYIGFVDSDDYVSEDMYELMYEKAISKKFDLVVCDLTYVYEDHTMPAYANIKQDLLDPTSVRASMTYIYPSAWNKLYHHRLFETDVKFQKGVWFEDVEMIYRLYPHIRSIGYVNKACYQYIQRSNAITSTFDERLFDYLKNWKSILAYYKKHDIFKKYEKELQYSCTRYLYATFIKAASNYQDKEMFDKAVKEARTFIKQNFKHPSRNTYFYRAKVKGMYLLCFNHSIANLIYRKHH